MNPALAIDFVFDGELAVRGGFSHEPGETHPACGRMVGQAPPYERYRLILQCRVRACPTVAAYG